MTVSLSHDCICILNPNKHPCTLENKSWAHRAFLAFEYFVAGLPRPPKPFGLSALGFGAFTALESRLVHVRVPVPLPRGHM